MRRHRWVAAGGMLLVVGVAGFLAAEGLDLDTWIALLKFVAAAIGFVGSVVTWIGVRSRRSRRARLVTQRTSKYRVQINNSSIVSMGDHATISVKIRPGWRELARPVSRRERRPEAAGVSDVAGQPDAVPQTGRELPTHNRENKLRELAVTYGEPAVVQALRDTASALAVVARIGSEAAS